MTVAKLISILEKIEDKENTIVFTYQNKLDGEWTRVVSIAQPTAEEETGVYIG